MKAIHARPSSLHRVAACPGSASFPQRHETGSVLTARGHLWHKVLAAMARAVVITSPLAMVLAGEFGLSGAEAERAAERLGPLVRGLPEGQRLSECAVNTRVETRGGPVTISGTADLVVISGDTLHLIDLKTGWTEHDAGEFLQGACYALGFLQRHGGIERVHLHVVMPDQWAVSSATFSREELEGWGKPKSGGFHRMLGSVLEAAAADSPAYNIGPQCNYCHGRGECPAYSAALAGVRDLVPMAVGFQDLTPAQKGEVYAKLKLIESAVADGLSLVKASAADAPIPLPDGREYGPVESSRSEWLATPESWPILSEALGERLWDVIEIGKTRTEEAIKAAAPPRGKGKAVKSFREAMEAAGAVKRTPFTTFRAYRSGSKQIEGESEE